MKKGFREFLTEKIRQIYDKYIKGSLITSTQKSRALMYALAGIAACLLIVLIVLCVKSASGKSSDNESLPGTAKETALVGFEGREGLEGRESSEDREGLQGGSVLSESGSLPAFSATPTPVPTPTSVPSPTPIPSPTPAPLTAAQKVLIPFGEEEAMSVENTGSLFAILDKEKIYENPKDTSGSDAAYSHVKRSFIIKGKGIKDTAKDDSLIYGADTIVEEVTQKTKKGTTTYTLLLNGYYELEVVETEHFYVLFATEPKEKYERIVVIDAGHGDYDPGALSEDETLAEKDINLSIVLYLKDFFDLQDRIKVYYTRTDDSYPSLTDRYSFANGLGADLFISVHCNSAEITSAKGYEILFNDRKKDMKPLCSRDLAEIIAEKLSLEYNARYRGLVDASGHIDIIHYAEMPVALLETGFLSNSEDALMLSDPDTQKRIAHALYESVVECYRRMEDE